MCSSASDRFITVTQLIVSNSQAELAAAASTLATELRLPYQAQLPVSASHALVLTPERLELHTLGKHAPGPVYVDFLHGASAWRRLHGGGKGQLLAKALGIKGEQTPRLIDTTAGLGRDSFVLATLGCQVTLLERSPLAFALLRDGLRRAAADAAVAPIVARMQLLHTDACDYLATLPPEAYPDCVLVDPMFPERGKAALAKKEMQAFQTLIGDDLDAPALLQAALRVAQKRVAVKRPRLGALIDGPRPDLQMAGQRTRFDIYFRLQSVTTAQ